jgi:nucleoside-diphosphate-sugar epimerase
MAAAAAASGVEGQVFNLGTGTEISIARLAEQVFELVGEAPPVVEAAERLRPPGSEVERLVADASKARELLRWEPAVSFEDGLRRTIEWVKHVLPTFKPELYNT